MRAIEITGIGMAAAAGAFVLSLFVEPPPVEPPAGASAPEPAPTVTQQNTTAALERLGEDVGHGELGASGGSEFEAGARPLTLRDLDALLDEEPTGGDAPAAGPIDGRD